LFPENRRAESYQLAIKTKMSLAKSWLVRTTANRSNLTFRANQLEHFPEVDSTAIPEFIRDKGKQVLTLTGYAGAEYQDAEMMLDAVEGALKRKDPDSWVVSSGATACGIGAAYKIAKQLGFTTLGIVSTRAIEESVPLSPCVDYVFYIEDTVWGGRLENDQLSPTSSAFIETGDEFLVIGGNEICRDEMIAASQACKPITYIQADMNHEIANAKAIERGTSLQVDYRGSAHATLISLKK